MKEILILYLLLINAAASLLMLLAKWTPKKKLRRLSEATLMSTAILGGGVGALLGMYTVRHKTRHLKFTLGIPLILAVQIGICLFLFAKYKGFF